MLYEVITILGKNDFTYTNYSYSDYNPYKLSSQPWFEKLDHAPAFSTYWVGLQPNYYDGVEKKESYVITIGRPRITSYNVCYTKLLRWLTR